MALLAVKDLTVTFPECDAPVLRDVSLEIRQGSFAVLCGPTGCGKTTLLRMCKRELAPLSTAEGQILFDGTPLTELTDRESAAGTGFVMQQPEQQIVTDRVSHELAFGLENLGTPPAVMHRRVAEIASYFGIDGLLDTDPSLLSGGQKQILNLASVMISEPRLLLLDEPTAQLDPIAALNFMTTLRRLNEDFGVTVLLAEHRLEHVLSFADTLIVMGNGTVALQGPPREICVSLPADSPVLAGMPAAVRLFRGTGAAGECPLTVREARRTVMPQITGETRALPEKPYTHSDETALSFTHAFFRYERHGRDILTDLSFRVFSGELYCLVGGNGAGKSTALAVAAGLHKLYAGDVQIFGRSIRSYKGRTLYRNCVTLLPQDVQTVFLKNTVAEEFSEIDRNYAEALRGFPYDFTPLLPQHPYDLSGGQQQLAALAKVLLSRPRLLLLDEPTKGLDAQAKAQLGDTLRRLCAEGLTVLCVTHDIEFAALYADRCGFLSHGALVSADEPPVFFSDNAFYTTAASRITRGFFERAVTVGTAVQIASLNAKRTKGA